MRRADFLRVTRRGRRVSTPWFLVFALARADPAPARLGITVTRKVGNAVRRNRIKRLVREWFRHSSMPPSWDVVVIAKREIPDTLAADQVARDLAPALPSRDASSSD